MMFVAWELRMLFIGRLKIGCGEAVRLVHGLPAGLFAIPAVAEMAAPVATQPPEAPPPLAKQTLPLLRGRSLRTRAFCDARLLVTHRFSPLFLR